MKKKKLLTEEITNELEGASLFFTQATVPEPDQTVVRSETPLSSPDKHILKREAQDDRVSMTSRKQAHTLASMQASEVNGGDDDPIETIRKTVKQVGKETLYVRLTPEEKHDLATIIITLNELYRGRARKTSENEVGRIAVNFLLNDFHKHGEASILARVLEALHA